MKDLHIVYALELADCNSFTEAAQRLYISQPALSKQIADLEAELGTVIFIRTHKGIELTPEGEVVISTFRQIKELMEQCRSKINALSRNNRKNLNIGCLAGLIPKDILGTAINTCYRQFPDVSVALEYKNHIELNSSLKAGFYDMILNFESSIDPNLDTKTELIAITPRALVFSDSHRLNNADELDYGLVRTLDFFVQAQRGTIGFDQYLRILTRNFGVAKHQIKFVPNVDSLITNVEAGLGVALMTTTPEITANPSLSYRIIKEDPQRTVAAWRQGTEHPCLYLFVETLKTLLADKIPGRHLDF